MDTVQIFIPTFNRRHFLEKAISSALNQSYESVEVIVLDNASTDETEVFMRDLVKSDDRIKYHRNSENLGMTGNFNQIRHFVSQPFFCVLPDDDTYQPHFLTTVMELFSLYPSIAFACGNAPIFRDGAIEQDLLAEWTEGFHHKATVVEDCINSKHPTITNCIFRGYLADEFIFEDVFWASDVFLLICLVTKYDMAITKTITGSWNLHGDNASLQRPIWNPDNYISELVARNKLYTEFCKKNGLPNNIANLNKKKLRIGLLQVGRKDKSSFDKIIKSNKDLKEYCGTIECQIIRLLSSVPFLEMAVSFKSLLRKVKVIK